MSKRLKYIYTLKHFTEYLWAQYCAYVAGNREGKEWIIVVLAQQSQGWKNVEKLLEKHGEPAKRLWLVLWVVSLPTV